MIKVALTGQIHSGKSTALEYFKKQGAATLSSDLIVHDLLSDNKAVYQEIQKIFPHAIVNTHIDRNVLADIVFKDSQKLHTLEKILHPYVIYTIKQSYHDHMDFQSTQPFIVEVPLLYETGFDDWFDYTIVLYQSNPPLQMNSKLSQEEIRSRSKRLDPIKTKIQKADFVIDNSNSIQSLYEQLDTILTALKSKKRQ